MRLSRATSALLFCAMLAHSPVCIAQEALSAMQPIVPPAGESIELLAGDIFEILPAHDIADPSYSWILTQERNYVKGEQGPAFRWRPVTPGTYTLFAQVQNGDGTRRLSRTFTIVIKARNPGDVRLDQGSMQLSATSGSLVNTFPKEDTNKNIIVDENSHLLKIVPLSTELKPLALDTDTDRDSDNDGSSNNDIDNLNTFFQSDATPIYVWFANGISKKTLQVTAVGMDGSPVVQLLKVLNKNEARDEGILTNPVHIKMQHLDDGTYSFDAEFEEAVDNETPLLFHWEFGDGTESLLQNATHQYAVAGNYTVKLQVRDLSDGRIVSSSEMKVDAQGTTNANSSSAMSDGAASSEASVPTNDTPAGPGIFGGMINMLKNLVMPVALFFAALVLAILAVFIFKKLRSGKSLEKTFEHLEKAVIKEAPAVKTPPLTISTTATSAPAPSTPQPSTVIERELNATAANPAKQVSPKVDEAAAPDWLKKGLGGEAPKAAPVASATPKPAAAAPTPAPAPVTPTPAPAPVTPTPAPAPVTPTPAPKPTQTPVVPAPAAPKPAPTPSPAPAPKPAAASSSPAVPPSTAAVPPWLKPQAPAPTSSPSVPAPAAPKPATPTSAPTSSPSVPAPAAPKPATPASAPAPKPAAPAPSPVPTPAPATPKPVAASPAPIAEPKTAPAAPPPAVREITPPPVTPAPTPVQVTPPPVAPAPATPAPVPAPTPAPSTPKPAATPIQPATPTPTPQPIEPANPASDNTIAIIRAENLNPKPDEGGKPAA